MREIYRKSFFKSVRLVHLLIEQGVVSSYPLPIKNIIKQDDGVILLTYQDLSEKYNYSMEQLQKIIGTSDAIHLTKDNLHAIAYNQNQDERKLRFSLAHEYGHYKLNHKGLECKNDGFHYDYNISDLEEYEANSFACCILFPLNIRYSYRGEYCAEEFADLFKITVPAATKALNILEEQLSCCYKQYIDIYKEKHILKRLKFTNPVFINDYSSALV